ncbi:MAG: TonB-dependent receptor domain-containing protein [Vulcanimicrobiaceae bacterium]
MNIRFTLRRTAVALLLLVAFLIQGTWALAGTTGSLGGNVTDESGKPIANAKITASSPSQTATTQTDGAGHFVFLSLAPDTYTVSAEKNGYAPASIAGAVVFADQIQNYTVSMHSALKTIAQVTSRASGSLVKSGTVSDVYSVNANTQQAVSALGGGGNLNSAYSAIYSQPGVNSSIGNYGFGQVFYIRGSEYNQVGYEFDGVPVNRAFDNYNGSSLSSLGQQELQVYTGAAPAGSATATVGGYVNQVIKTGTFPGFGSATLGIGAPTFYHQAQVEAGGASPNRNFSYYAALGGYNQQFRLYNNQNGGNLGLDSGLYGVAFPFSTQFYGNGAPACLTSGLTPNTGYAAGAGCVAMSNPGGFNYQDGNSDREAVVNLHFGLPHKNDGGKDDLQLLYTGSSFHTDYAESINDIGGLGSLNEQFGGDFCGATGDCNNGQLAIPYEDGYIFAPGTKFGQLASTATAVPYLFPNTGSNRVAGGIMPDDQRNTIFNDSNILKAQYQKNFGSKAYARIYGYSLYSDWLQNGPTFGVFGYQLGGWCCSGGVSRDYELEAHTRGGEFQFADQFNSKNLVTLTANYVTSTVGRFNNGTMSNGLGTAATNLTDGTNCYSYATGQQASCLSSSTSGSYGDPTRSTACATLASKGTPCAATPAGAQWEVTVPGERGTYNTVVPKFTSVALTDEFRPTDKLDLNLGVRFEQFQYDLASPGADFPFWYNAAASSYCYNLTTLAPLVGALRPGMQPPATPLVVNGECSTVAPGYAHPTASDPENTRGLIYSAGTGGVLSSNLFSPRIGFTYTVNPDTVVRGSYGRYAEPVTTAAVQYLDKSGKSSAAFNFANFWQYGFTTPVHPLVPQVSNNADLSLEKRLHGTDVSFKVSPFYRYTTNQLNSISIGPNFVSSLNVGTQKSYGVEVALSKGDPTRNGLAGQISYTYTRTRIKFSDLANGTNTIDPINSYITAYNALTKAGGGSPCYDPTATDSTGANAPDPSCKGTSIANPYYNSNPQQLLDRNGWYDTYPNEFPFQAGSFGNQESTAIAPNVFSGYLNYKHDRLTVTPTFQLNEGTSYGNPLAAYGVDPRFCASNQANTGSNPYTGVSYGPVAGSTTPTNANYLTCGPTLATGDGYLAVPNPQTGSFDGMAQYRNPWQFNLGMQIGYDLTSKVHANLILANIVNRCFGGTKTAWTSQFPANNQVCGYVPNGALYQSNFFNGSGPNDPVNGVALPALMQQSYAPLGGLLPFQAYVNVQIKL